MAREHVVVVGAGAFGGWSALALLRAGLRVTLIDAWGPGNARASSGGETRVIRAAYGGVPEYSAMAARALPLWSDFEQQCGRRLLFGTGALWMFDGDDGYVRRSLPFIDAAGLSIVELDVMEASRRYPQFNFDDIRSAYFEPNAGFIAARAACRLVLAIFQAEGGEYIQSRVAPVTSSEAALASVRLTDGSVLKADRFVFACGPWLGQTFPDVIGRRILATRREVFFFGTPSWSAQYDAGAMPVWVHMGKRFVYGIPAHDGRGLKIADDTKGEEVDPTTMDRTPSAAGIANARGILADRFPALADAPLLEARVCQYESTSDGHFLIDVHPQLSNVWLVGGGSGHGFKMGPAIGEHVADLVQGRTTAKSLFTYERLQTR